MDVDSPRRGDADLEIIDNTQVTRSSDTALGINLLEEACCQASEEMDGSGRGLQAEQTPLLNRPTAYPRARQVTPWLALLSCLFFAGPIYGWTPMQAMLVRRGAFSYECDAAETSCAAQLETLSAVYSLATFANEGSAFLVGVLVDLQGSEVTVLLSGTAYVVAYVMIACFEFFGDWSLFVAFVLLGIGGMGFFLAAFRAAGLTESRVVFLTAASCLYDSSSGVFLVVQGLLNVYDDGYGHFRAAFLLLAVLSLFLTLALAYAWRLSGADLVDREVDNRKHDDAPRLYNRPFGAGQLHTLEFGLLSAWTILGMFKAIGYLGTIYDWLDAIGDGTNSVPDLIAGLVVAGCLWIPILAHLFRLGLCQAAHVINVIGLAFSICVAIPSVTSQIIGAIVYAAFRSAFFASVPNFCAELFGQKSIGRTAGLMYTMGGFAAILCTPIVWAGESGYWSWVNAGNCLLVVPMTGCILSLHMFSAELCLELRPPSSE